MTDTRVRAAELPADLHWLNTPAPLTLAGQRGRVVLLEFWSYCCLDCLNVLPDLRYLKDKYHDWLTVIGLHSPRFPNERADAQLAKAINRTHIRHPVANDPELRLWSEYGINALPSFAVVDTHGCLVQVLSGTGQRKALDALIETVLEQADQGIEHETGEIPLTPQSEPASVLSFPGKVLATDSRLYISNSGRNTVLETTLAGQIRRVFGSGTPGLLDGRGVEAAFNNPQGLACDHERLYVADAGNHAIRSIDLVSGEVQTIAGNSVSSEPVGAYRAAPRHAALISPWDLAWRNGVLFIAMAGAHQIWRLQLGMNTAAPLAGSGHEDMADGTALHAAFAQPSGLSLGQTQLYVADAKASAIRSVRVATQAVTTLVGKGLFVCGDSDGVGTAARLQHPLDVAYDAKCKILWIADSYNHKLKKLDVNSNALSSHPIECALNEPGGLCMHQDTLWIANTNAHEIVRVAAQTGRCQVVGVHE